MPSDSCQRGHEQDPPFGAPLPLTKNWPLPTILTFNEMQTFLNALEPFYWALFLRLYHAGMRKQEALNLTWPDIHFNTGAIHILGKGDKERYVPMTAMLTEALRMLTAG